MIQRIQSIYLLLASIMMALVSQFSLMSFKDYGGEILPFGIWGLFFKDMYDEPALGVMAITFLVVILSFLSIFFYKNRKRQMLLCKINIFLILSFYLTVGAYVYFEIKSNTLLFESFKLGFVFPALALIFTILALMRIKSDEKLVRSLDRIR